MKYEVISVLESEDLYFGEAITVAGVMAIICVAVMAVVVYKLFTSSKGSTTIPGGWKFSWA